MSRIAGELGHRATTVASSGSGIATHVTAVPDRVGVDSDLLGDNLRVQQAAMSQEQARHGGGQDQTRQSGE